MKKALLFARVSTTQQDLERQKELLYPLIKEDGYTEDDIAVIEYKESAIKNDVQHRKSIKEMKELIALEPIEAVYVTEISRLGRRNDVLYDVFALLAKERIALIVQSPSLIRTINKDGSDNLMGQMVISFMQHLAVSEMKVKTERSKSGMQTRKKQGHLVTAYVKFGYKRSEDNRPIIDNENAEIVRKCFQMYLDGNSCGIIYDKIHFITKWSLKTSAKANKVASILKDPTYIGKNPHFPYPPIIDEETFNKVQELLVSNTTVKYKTSFVYYCHKLIKWNGHTFTPSHSTGRYSLTYEGKYYGVNIDCLDGLIKNLAFEAYSIISERDDQATQESLLEAKEIANKKIIGIDADIKRINNGIDKVKDSYFEGDLEKDEYKFRLSKLSDELNFLVKEKDEVNVTLLKVNEMLESNTRTASYISLNLDEIKDDNEIADIINSVIKSVDLEKIENGWKINVTYKDEAFNEQKKGIYYKYIKYNHKIINLYVCSTDNDFVEDWTGCWEKRLLNSKKGGSN